jgi:hypothetical protein
MVRDGNGSVNLVKIAKKASTFLNLTQITQIFSEYNLQFTSNQFKIEFYEIH